MSMKKCFITLGPGYPGNLETYPKRVFSSAHDALVASLSFEPPRGKTNNVVSEQVGHKPTCTSTEKS